MRRTGGPTVLLALSLTTTLAAAPATAHGQTTSADGTAFSLHAGPSAPVGDLARRWDLGYHLGGGVNVPWREGRRLRFEASWNRLGGDARGLFETFSGESPGEAEVIEGTAFSVLSAIAALELGLGSMAGVATPYLVGGLGYALLTYGGGALLIDGQRITVEENRDSGVAGTAGAGVRIQMAETMAVFSEVRVLAGWPFDDRVEVLFPFQLGVSLTP